jgi:hypothetical protein
MASKEKTLAVQGLFPGHFPFQASHEFEHLKTA